jgi:PPK2 family polyphosphate:nucleotide phosphotransferase
MTIPAKRHLLQAATLISYAFSYHNEFAGEDSPDRRLEALDYRKQFRVKTGEKLRLKRLDPSSLAELTSEDEAKDDAKSYLKELALQQALLYAEHKHSVLVVLQAMDAGGKDGTIRHVFGGVNPQGVDVASFKQPTPLELSHDFLWRIHAQAPRAGQIVIFNRSHYEDVLVTRVHKLIDKKTCVRRYEHIRDFEALLAQSGTTILKFFLHISKEEQLARFAQRLDDPGRNWKISESDYSERELWDDYVDAFEDAISATSTVNAPWYVIPSNHKWFRNLAVSQIIKDSIADLDLAYPAPSVNLADIKRKYHAALEASESGKKQKARKKG